MQISATIPDELHQKVKVEAARDSRSFSETVGILLSQAIKERERQRAKGKRVVSNEG